MTHTENNVGLIINALLIQAIMLIYLICMLYPDQGKGQPNCMFGFYSLHMVSSCDLSEAYNIHQTQDMSHLSGITNSNNHSHAMHSLNCGYQLNMSTQFSTSTHERINITCLQHLTNHKHGQLIWQQC